MWTPLLVSFGGSLFHLAAVPLVGAGLLLFAFRVLRVSPLTFFQCWKAYLAAVAYGLIFILIAGLFRFARPEANSAFLAVQRLGVCLTQFIALVFLVRRFSFRPLLAQGGTVLFTNLAVISLVLLAKNFISG